MLGVRRKARLTPTPVGETGCANGGAASRGPGCRTAKGRPKLGGSRSEVRRGRSPKLARPRQRALMTMKPAQESARSAWREAASSVRRQAKSLPAGARPRERRKPRDRACPPVARRIRQSLARKRRAAPRVAHLDARNSDAGQRTPLTKLDKRQVLW